MTRKLVSESYVPLSVPLITKLSNLSTYHVASIRNVAPDKWFVIWITSPFILIQLIPCSFLSFWGSDPNQKMETEINAYDLVHMWNKLKKSLCVFSSCFIQPLVLNQRRRSLFLGHPELQMEHSPSRIRKFSSHLAKLSLQHPLITQQLTIFPMSPAGLAATPTSVRISVPEMPFPKAVHWHYILKTFSSGQDCRKRDNDLHLLQGLYTEI